MGSPMHGINNHQHWGLHLALTFVTKIANEAISCPYSGHNLQGHRTPHAHA